ncbi:sigma-54 interaction domain-containing protein [Bdellovibrionota bacterium]
MVKSIEIFDPAYADVCIPVDDEGNCVIITNNSKIKEILRIAASVANSRAPILIQGLSGTGKDVFANYIHRQSKRAPKPLIAINCAAIPSGLLESELFGYERGAFTGADQSRPGKFELSDGGILLLDEIGEMELRLQAKLLRAIQEGIVDRIGGRKPIQVNFKLIATTNRNLKEMVGKGQFRQDLFYRINTIPIILPKLAERREDIEAYTHWFRERFARENQKTIRGISQGAMKQLLEFPWEGNIRELENTIERAVLLCQGTVITSQDLRLELSTVDQDRPEVTIGGTIREAERALILTTLKRCNGNRTQAAKHLGISLRTLRNKLARYRSERGREMEL